MERIISAVPEILQRLDITTVFVIPGSLMEVLSELDEDPKINLVTAYHEEQLGFMAIGYYQMTGRPAAIMVSQGPGETNLTTALACAYREQIPVIVISSFQSDTSRYYFQDTSGTRHSPNVRGIMECVTGTCFQISRELDDKDITEICRSISVTSLPVYIAVDTNKTHDIGIFSRVEKVFQREDDVDIKDFLHSAAQADHTAFLVGNGIRNSAAEILSMLFMYKLPVFTTLKAADIVTSSYAYSGGHVGFMGKPEANEYLAQHCMQLIALGTSLSENTLAKWYRPFSEREGTIVQIGAEQTLEIPGIKYACYHFSVHPDRNAVLGKGISSVSSNGFEQILHSGTAKRCFVLEAYRRPFISTLSLRAGERLLMCGGFGALGSSISMATGAAVGNLDYIYVVFCGDGGFMFSGMTAMNISRLNLPVMIVINVNHEYRTVADSQRKRMGRAVATELVLPGIEYSEQFWNIPTYCARTLEAFEGIFSKFQSERTPVIVCIDDSLYESSI